MEPQTTLSNGVSESADCWKAPLVFTRPSRMLFIAGRGASIAQPWRLEHQQNTKKDCLQLIFINSHFQNTMVGAVCLDSSRRSYRFWGANSFENAIPVLFGCTLHVNYPHRYNRLCAWGIVPNTKPCRPTIVHSLFVRVPSEQNIGPATARATEPLCLHIYNLTGHLTSSASFANAWYLGITVGITGWRTPS